MTHWLKDELYQKKKNTIEGNDDENFRKGFVYTLLWSVNPVIMIALSSAKNAGDNPYVQRKWDNWNSHENNNQHP